MTNEEIIAKLEERIAAGHEIRQAQAFRALDTETEDRSGEMVVEGYATTFNDPYLLYEEDFLGTHYEMWEQVDSRAFDDADMQDVIMQYDHAGRVYARTRNDSLKLTPDNHGLFTRADLSGAADGAGLYGDIKNGLIDRMSWRFVVAEQKKEVTEDTANKVCKIMRTITKVKKVYDVSAVSIPANDGTEISARSFMDGAIHELEAERLAHAQMIAARKRLALRIRTGGYDEKH